ncbi:MAG: DUF2341 domain-containing protein [Bacteroidetes bacterium]|nr:MAG: DUF2341 domain-containing protein [Bacteroidota bacterium]
MKNKIKYILLIFLTIFGTRLSAQLPGWRECLYYEVNNSSNAEDLQDYQIRIAFNHYDLVQQGRSRADGGDIRFSSCDGQVYDYWIEYGVNSTYCLCWVKLPFMAKNTKGYVLLNFGNDTSINRSDPDKVFEFYDGFDSTAINGNKWTRTGGSNVVNGWLEPVLENSTWGGSNYIYNRKNFRYLNNRCVLECEVRSNLTRTGGNIIFFVDNANSPNHYLIQHETRALANSDGDFGYKSGGAGGELTPNFIYQWNANERVFYQIRMSSRNNFYHNRFSTSIGGRQITGSVAPTNNWNWNFIGFSALGSFPFHFAVNYVRVRKYTPREPGVALTNTSVLVADPGVVDFGWLVCENNSSMTVTLTNSGKNAMNVTRSRFRKGASSNYITSRPDTMQIQPDEIREINLSFNPNGNGNFDDTLIIENVDPCIPPLLIPIFGRKDSVKFDLTDMTSDTLDFGVLCLGDTKDTGFTVANYSTMVTTLSSNTFSSLFNYAGQNPLYKPINKDESRFVKLSFTATQKDGIYYDSLTITDTCGITKTVYLKAIVTQPVFTTLKDTFDFGRCTLWCDTLKTDTIRITNSSRWGTDGRIRDFVIYGQFGNPELSQIGLIKNDVIKNNASTTYPIVFSPKRTGVYSDSMTIIFEPCGFEKTIYLKGEAVETGFEARLDTVDYGFVTLNQVKDTTLIFRNTGTADLNITTIGGITGPYSLLNTAPPLPALLTPNQAINVILRFNSLDTLFHQITISLSGNPCAVEDSVAVFAKGVPIIAKTLVYIPNTFGRTGEQVDIPLILESSERLVQSGINAFEATIRMNKNLLKPVNVNPGSMNIINNYREISVSGSWKDTNGILYNFRFIPALGDSECTDIEIIKFRWLNGLTNMDIISGRFCLVDVCKEGGLRLIEGTTQSYLKQSLPEPAIERAVIEFSLIEEGHTKLYLSDIQGRCRAVLFDKEILPGIYKIDVDLSGYETGVYQYILMTPTNIYRRLMRVVK